MTIIRLILSPIITVACIACAHQASPSRSIAHEASASALSALKVKEPGQALWKIMQRCTVSHGDPCVFVDPNGRFGVVKDIRGETHHLLIPLERTMGIEDPDLLADDSPNYWAAAWSQREFVSRNARRPLHRDEYAMGINSPGARSQNQLHIHIDCVAPGVSERLRSLESAIGRDWSAQPFEILGVSYKIMRLNASLGDRVPEDPFRLLAKRLADPGNEMKNHALTMIGAVFSDDREGFYLLDAESTWLWNASGEHLIDRNCLVLR